MERILDFSQELDVPTLDQVVQVMYTTSGAQQQEAQKVLTQFQEHPEAWQRVPGILETATNIQSKYLALQIMNNLITTRWKALPADQRSGIRNFVVGVVIKISSTSDEDPSSSASSSSTPAATAYLHTSSARERTAFINKLNLIVVQILKQEWPNGTWPNAIEEIISSSKSNLGLCENNMVILRLLSEEVFDFSAEQMTSTKVKTMKNQFCLEFQQIFTLCREVLDQASKVSLIRSTLETLLRFLSWIPLGYVWETGLIDTLVGRFLEAREFRNVTLKCLAEVGALNIGPEYNQKFVVLFNMIMTSVNKMLPPQTDIASVYDGASDDDQQLVLNLALFLTSYLSAHLKLLENEENKAVLLNAHLYLIKISQVEEREVFKVCLEYWATLVSSLYEEAQTLPLDMAGMLNLSLGGRSDSIGLRKNLYAEILSNLRIIIIGRMVKPEEVLVVENDEGEIVREHLKEIDTIVLYKNMREVLVYLTHLDVADTEAIMTEKLQKQVDGSEWSWANLNTLCWAIGSISGAMNEEAEKRFLVTVIKDLLGLCEFKRGKDNKAVVASNIMYIVGQYPRFLKAHWKFLKTVVNKNFEFMHETHEGVQDMACDTFLKIAQKCRRHFVFQQPGEKEPFIDEILRDLSKITMDLSPHQVQTCYEAIGYMVAAQPNKAVQERLIAKMMEMPNAAWDNLMRQAASNVDVLASPENIKILSNILKTNVSACTSIGTFFLPQITRIYSDMLGLYRAVSGIISDTIAADGLIATRTPKVRGLRTIKKEILKLVETHIRKAEELETISTTLVPPLLDAVLGDYNRNIPAARDAEVLHVMAAIIHRLGQYIIDSVPAMLDAIFEPTLDMINKDLAEYPEHRVGFFKFMQMVNRNCFPALLKLDGPQFKLTMDAFVWGLKHTMRDIADTGLTILLELINNFAAADSSVSNAFFQQYFLSMLQDLFFVLTDSEHKSGFKNQSILLARLFYLVESGTIQAPLFDAAAVSDPSMTNQQFVRQYCANLLGTAFPHVQQGHIQSFVTGLLELNQDPIKFKLNLRDFLIQLKEFSGDDTDDLYKQEAQEEKEKKDAEDREKALNIPGMVKPSELPPNEDEEL